MIPGDVPVWIRTADDRSNSGSLITAPAPALHLTAGDIYAPSIMVAGNLGALSLQLGQNCTISGDRFSRRYCPIINETNISIRTLFNESIDIRTIYYSIMIDGGFKDRMMVTFSHFLNRKEYNISGYLYFDAGCDSCTQSPPTNDNSIVNTQCDCSTTGNSDPTRPTDTPCQEVVAMLISGSTLNHQNFPWAGSVFIVVVVSMLLSAT